MPPTKTLIHQELHKGLATNNSMKAPLKTDHLVHKDKENLNLEIESFEAQMFIRSTSFN